MALFLSLDRNKKSIDDYDGCLSLWPAMPSYAPIAVYNLWSNKEHLASHRFRKSVPEFR